MLIYGTIILFALAGLVAQGFIYILYLAIPGISVFAWHLHLVSKRVERRQAGFKILATGALSLAAQVACWIGQAVMIRSVGRCDCWPGCNRRSLASMA